MTATSSSVSTCLMDKETAMEALSQLRTCFSESRTSGRRTPRAMRRQSVDVAENCPFWRPIPFLTRYIILSRAFGSLSICIILRFFLTRCLSCPYIPQYLGSLLVRQRFINRLSRSRSLHMRLSHCLLDLQPRIHVLVRSLKVCCQVCFHKCLAERS
jgi:hypothetical protein